MACYTNTGGKSISGEGSSSEPHVLAVDDSLVDRRVITSLLRKSKYRGMLNKET